MCLYIITVNPGVYFRHQENIIIIMKKKNYPWQSKIYILFYLNWIETEDPTLNYTFWWKLYTATFAIAKWKKIVLQI